MPIRCFLAFPITVELNERFKLILHVLQQTRADVKWVEPSNIHLTLKFLGDLKESNLSNVLPVLQEACQLFSPCSAQMTAIGAFPDRHHPKMIWGFMDDPKKKIHTIAEELENRLQPLGIPKDDHPFKPHMTIGRVRSSANLTDLIRAMEQLTFEDKIEEELDKIILYKSTLTPQGPVYDVLYEFKMRRDIS